jgi:Fe2+ transport system protein FeoA
MYIPLSEAPIGRPLRLVRVSEAALEDRLARMGLTEAASFERLDETVMLQSIRVRGPKGDAVIAPGMGAKVVVHLDDDRRVPLAELRRGDAGHIEGITCGSALERTLQFLGLEMDARVAFIRALPAMDYQARIVEDSRRVHLPEGTVCKLWGRAGERERQFCMAPPGEPFRVEAFLCGPGAEAAIRAHGIEIGKTLVLESVAPSQNIFVGPQGHVVISTTDGLRLILETPQAHHIWVREQD